MPTHAVKDQTIPTLSPVLVINNLQTALCIYALGTGLGLFALALITNLTTSTMGQSHVARTYSSIAFVETAGLLIGVPLLTAVWIAGLKIGGMALGLTFWMGAVSLTTRKSMKELSLASAV